MILGKIFSRIASAKTFMALEYYYVSVPTQTKWVVYQIMIKLDDFLLTAPFHSIPFCSFSFLVVTYYLDWKWKCILIELLDEFWINSFWYCNSRNTGFLSITYNVKFETTSVSLLYLVALKSICVSCTLNEPFTLAWYHNIMCCSVRNYWFTKLHSFDKRSHSFLV
jgi:hypothetical protein